MGRHTSLEAMYGVLTGHSRSSSLMRPAYGPVPRGPNRKIFEVVATRIAAVAY